MSQQTPIQQKLEAMNNQRNKRLTCECGSTSFYQVRVEEYRDLSYGQTSFSLLSQNSEPMLVCICGIPVLPTETGAAVNAESGRGRFLRAAKAAIEFRKKNSPNELAKAFVSVEEHNSALARLEDVEGQLAWMEDAIRALSGEGSEGGDGIDEESSETGSGGGAETGTQQNTPPAKSAAKKNARSS